MIKDYILDIISRFSDSDWLLSFLNGPVWGVAFIILILVIVFSSSIKNLLKRSFFKKIILEKLGSDKKNVFPLIDKKNSLTQFPGENTVGGIVPFFVRCIVRFKDKDNSAIVFFDTSGKKMEIIVTKKTRYKYNFSDITLIRSRKLSGIKNRYFLDFFRDEELLFTIVGPICRSKYDSGYWETAMNSYTDDFQKIIGGEVDHTDAIDKRLEYEETLDPFTLKKKTVSSGSLPNTDPSGEFYLVQEFKNYIIYEKVGHFRRYQAFLTLSGILLFLGLSVLGNILLPLEGGWAVLLLLGTVVLNWAWMIFWGIKVYKLTKRKEPVSVPRIKITQDKIYYNPAKEIHEETFQTSLSLCEIEDIILRETRNNDFNQTRVIAVGHNLHQELFVGTTSIVGRYSWIKETVKSCIEKARIP